MVRKAKTRAYENISFYFFYINSFHTACKLSLYIPLTAKYSMRFLDSCEGIKTRVPKNYHWYVFSDWDNIVFKRASGSKELIRVSLGNPFLVIGESYTISFITVPINNSNLSFY
jgi:hypothetical protein